MSGRNLRFERMGFKHPKLACYMQCRESCQQWAAKVAEWPADWHLNTFERVDRPREEAEAASAKAPKTKKKAKHDDRNGGYADDGFVGKLIECTTD